MKAPVWLAGLAAAWALSGQDPPQNPPTFRGTTDLVSVTVSVKSGRSYVSNLTAEDFRLEDSGVRQQIRAVWSESLPTDVTLLVDTSGSVVRSIGRFRSDVKKIAGALRPGDRLRLLAFDTDVREIAPMQERGEKIPVELIQTGDRTSLLDAVVFALARGRQTDRHHLVFVFTDGYDNSSLLGYGALPELAARSDAVLHAVVVRVTGMPDDSDSLAFRALASAARRTGGVYYPPAKDVPDVVDAFKEALDAFRHSYVLYFSPSGVTRDGWHPITVEVVRPGTYDVQARAGYMGG